MGFFLGKIHFFLFDKIKYFEDLEKDLIQFANSKGIDIDISKLYEDIGSPTNELPLEYQIDLNNVHQWLQNQIKKDESRQAYIINTILSENIDILELKEVFKKYGQKLASLEQKSNLSPKEAYDILNKYLLEGMPCDIDINFTANSKYKLSFLYQICTHFESWYSIGADIKYFYILRNEWIRAFIQKLDSSLDFIVDEKDESYKNIYENTFSIVKI